MRHGAGPGRTRDDHLDVAAQLLAALARARQVRELAELIGAGALSATDQLYLEFDDAFGRDLSTSGRTSGAASTRRSTGPGGPCRGCPGASSRCCPASCSTSTSPAAGDG